MRVFVTGASGHLASAIVPDLIAAGHEVTGLARSDAAAAAVTALGAAVHRGDLGDLDGLGKAAADSDGVIHLAFDHGQMRTGDYAGPLATDLAVLRALGDALEGTGKPLVGTSGTLAVAGLGRPAPAGTRPGTRASRCARSPRASAPTWTCPPRASRPPASRPTSGSSPALSPWTAR